MSMIMLFAWFSAELVVSEAEEVICWQVVESNQAGAAHKTPSAPKASSEAYRKPQEAHSKLHMLCRIGLPGSVLLSSCCCNWHLQGLHIAFRNQIDTGEEAAKVVRSHTSIMAASPAGPAAALPYDAAYSDTEPGAGLMPGSELPGSGAVGNGPGGMGYPNFSNEHHLQVPGRVGGMNGGGDVVLQMSSKARQ